MSYNKNIATISTLAAVLMTSTASVGQENTLYIGGPGGSTQNMYEEQLIPAFEAETGANVVYVPGSSSDTLAKVIAQKGNQDLSLMNIDSSIMLRAVGLGDICAPLPPLQMLPDLYPNAVMDGGQSVGAGFYAVGLVYNTEVFERNGWEAPTSWNDLGDPTYRGKVAIGPISGYGIEALVMVAKANGGSEINIEPGFTEFSENIAPNVFAWEGSQATLAQMLQTGEAALSVWGNTRVIPLAEQGAPVKFVYPEDGTEQAMTTSCMVNGAPEPELARQFMEYLLSPDGQTILAEYSGYGPVNSKVELAPEIAARVVYGPEQVNALIPTDWNAVNEQRDEWVQRWNREVER